MKNPKKLTFLSSPIASKHSANWSFSLWSACYPDEVRLERSDSQAVILNCTFEQAKFMWCHSIRNWLCIIQKASKMYFFHTIITHLDKISCTWNHENVAWLLSTVQNGGSDVEFWAPLEMNFIRKTGTLEAETSVSG